MDSEALQLRMWLDLLTSEKAARAAQHQVTSRAEMFIAAGLDMERVLDALRISRATWYRRVEALRSWETEHTAEIPLRHLESVREPSEIPIGERTGGTDTSPTGKKAMLTGEPDVPGAVDRIDTTAQADVVIPHAPVDPTAGGLTDSRHWCRWCGHRVIEASDGGWVHHVSDGSARVDGIIEVPDCPGDEPLPAA